MDQQVIPLFPMYQGRSDMGAQTVVWKALSMRWAKVHYANDGAMPIEVAGTIV